MADISDAQLTALGPPAEGEDLHTLLAQLQLGGGGGGGGEGGFATLQLQQLPAPDAKDHMMPLTCPICMEDEPEITLETLHCGHSACIDCLPTFVAIHSKDLSQYPVHCFKCEDPLTYAEITKYLKGDTDKIRAYDRFTGMHALLASGDARPLSCPLPQCNTLMAVSGCGEEDTKEARQVCIGCSEPFCVRCEAVWHEGETCIEFQHKLKSKCADSGFKLQLLAKEKKYAQCPECNGMIEKTGGCNHITHYRSQGCSTTLEATHFCSQCFMRLGGKHHKTEPDGITLHYPRGLFQNCRVTVEADPTQAKKLKKAQVNTDGSAFITEEDMKDRVWRNGLLQACFCPKQAPDNPGKRLCVLCCCPCLLGARVEDQLVGDQPICGQCCGWCCCFPCKALNTRSTVRGMFGIHGNVLFDCCAVLWCPCCTMEQTQQEVHERVNNPF